MAEIQIKQVAKRFGKTEALRRIDLVIEDKEFLVLLGASGCGKTTLLRIVAGLETATTGEVWIGEKRVDRLAPKDRGIAMVFQNYAVFPHLTVYENIAFGLRMAKLDNNEIEKRVNRTAEMMHIEALLQRYSGQLSGGQRQRVAVSRALATEPAVILMDEPLSNLDALLRMEMRTELKSILAESATTTIYVTHDQVEAMSMADRIAIMHGGDIVQVASPVEVYRNPSSRFVGSFIGSPPMNFLPAHNVSKAQWKVGDATLDGPVSDKTQIEFAIRPEDLTVGRGPINAQVKVVEPLGSHLQVSCLVGQTLIRVIMDSDSAISPGDAIALAPIPDRIRWYDPDSKLAL